MDDGGKEFMKEFGELGRVHKVNAPGVTIMTRVSGSRCFNLNIETSDWDWTGVYVAPLSSLVGLNLHPAAEAYTTDKPNTQFHELRRFAEMLYQGLPAAIESLFCDRMIHVTPPWIKLQAMREQFVTKQCLHKYVQYGRGQLRKYLAGQSVHTTGGKPGEKWLYHCLRLAMQSVKLSQGESPNNWHTGDEREELLKIRRKEYAEEQVIAKVRELFDKAWDQYDDMPRPEAADAATLNQWVLETRGVKQ